MTAEQSDTKRVNANGETRGSERPPYEPYRFGREDTFGGRPEHPHHHNFDNMMLKDWP